MPTPVFVPLPAELLEPCVAKFLYPPGAMPIASIEDKVEALELALAWCNNDKEVIRSKQPAQPVQ